MSYDLKIRSDDDYSQSVPYQAVAAYVAKLQALGWKSRVSLEEGFRRTIESFLTESAR